MRKSLLFLLLATAAVPAFAADDASDRAARRDAARAERAEARSERSESRAEPPQRAEKPQRAEQSEQRQAQPVVQLNDGNRAAVREERRDAVQQRVVERRGDRQVVDQAHPKLEPRRQAADSVRDARREQRAERRAGRGPQTPPVVSPVPREGTQPPVVSTGSGSSARHWNGSWRNDHNYDWYNWRNRNRSLFRLGFYFDPFGWNYRPYSIGWRLWPNYYRSSYWLDDPWQYRLPRAYPGTQWIRYYDDAILVDTWSGEVVDVIYNFFW